MTEKIWTPEDDLRRYFPATAERLDRLPFADIAQFADEIERELKDDEKILLEVARASWAASEANLSIEFPYGRQIRYMLVKPSGGPPAWRSTWWRSA